MRRLKEERKEKQEKKKEIRRRRRYMDMTNESYISSSSKFIVISVRWFLKENSKSIIRFDFVVNMMDGCGRGEEDRTFWVPSSTGSLSTSPHISISSISGHSTLSFSFVFSSYIFSFLFTTDWWWSLTSVYDFASLSSVCLSSFFFSFLLLFVLSVSFSFSFSLSTHNDTTISPPTNHTTSTRVLSLCSFLVVLLLLERSLFLFYPFYISPVPPPLHLICSSCVTPSTEHTKSVIALPLALSLQWPNMVA